MDLTTLVRVTSLMKKKAGDTSDDVLIARLIGKYSQAFEMYLRRKVEVTSRTEVKSVILNQDEIYLEGYPVTSVTSVKWSDTRDFTSASSLTADNDYVLEPESGIIRLRFTFETERSYIQVVYSGGMAVDQAAFTTAYPDISETMDLQIAYHLRRTANPNSNVSVMGANKDYESPLRLLPDALETLNRYSRLIA